jgi:rare lipoprotein A
MANGEVLDDAVPTVAINSLPLNSVVKITNINNGRNILVRVTDTGGFEKYGRVADLSLAAKTYLECEDLCDVSIEKLTLDNHNTNTLQ